MEAATWFTRSCLALLLEVIPEGQGWNDVRRLILDLDAGLKELPAYRKECRGDDREALLLYRKLTGGYRMPEYPIEEMN